MAARCCISATLSEKIMARFFPACTIEPKEKSAITSRLDYSSEKVPLVPRDTQCSSQEHVILHLHQQVS